MSLAIDVDRVTAVLLADGWHDVARSTFGIDAYEYVQYSRADRDDFFLLASGSANGLSGAGFMFCTPDNEGTATDELIAGPLTAILAVRYASAD